jgi:3-oxoacyl-[acyl-carrier protein] reductase
MLERVGEHVAPGRGAETAESFAARIPAGRLGDPAEAARAAAWLCSEEASYVHGSCFAVDGGLSAI